MKKIVFPRNWVIALLFLISVFGLANCGGGGGSSSGGEQGEAEGGNGGNGGGGNGGAGGGCAIGDLVRITCSDPNNAGIFIVVTIGNGICEVGGGGVVSEADLLNDGNEEFAQDGLFDCSDRANGICGDPAYTNDGTTDPDCPEFVAL